MNRIIYKVLQRSLSLQRLDCNSKLGNFQTIPVVISRSVASSGSALQQKTNTPNESKTNAPHNTPTADAGTTAAVAAKKKSKLTPKITLIGQNHSITVTTLDEAQKLAKRRDLNLLLTQELDTKAQRPVYKLVTAAEMIAEELAELKADGKTTTAEKDKSSHKKSEKSLTIGARISEHDLESRLKSISKWLTKQHEVRILIQGSSTDMTSGEQIVKAIEKTIKDPNVIGKIVQKRVKGQIIKFNILPVAPATQQA